MTAATNRFTTSTGFITAEPQGIVPPGVTVISLDEPAFPDSLVKVIYAPAGYPEHHKTCMVSKVIYEALRHEQNRQ